MDYTRLTKNAPPTRPISWKSWSKQKPRTRTRMPCWTTQLRAHTANNSPYRLLQKQKGRWPRTESMGTYQTHGRLTVPQSNKLRQTDSRYPSRRVHIPRDHVNMEEQRPRDYFQNQIREIPRAAHREGHQGQRRPECDEPRTGNTTTACIAARVRSKRSRSTAHKSKCSTPEPIPTIR